MSKETKSNAVASKLTAVNPQDQVAQAALAAQQAVGAVLTGAQGFVARPYALAQMVQKRPGESGTQSAALEAMLSAYYAQTLAPRVPQYLAVHALLSERGHVSADERFAINTGDYIWAVPARKSESIEEDEDDSTALALVFETPGLCFIVVFNYDGGWSMHIRQYWRDVKDVPGSSLHRNARGLSAEDLVMLSSDAVDFSDAIPGASYVLRPALSTYLSGSLLAGDKDAGNGLLYGDGRDKGYIASVQEEGVAGLPTVQDGAYVPYGLLNFVVTCLDGLVASE